MTPSLKQELYQHFPYGIIVRTRWNAAHNVHGPAHKKM